MKVIELRAIEFTRFEQKILCSIDLVVEQGDFIVLVGPNGSGKSTLLKMISGETKPTSGQVLVLGQNIVPWPTHKTAGLVATLSQDLRLSTFSELSVLMNMQLALARVKNNIKDQDELKTYLANFNQNLAERLDVPAGQLSGGQKQALALAMCFVHKPSVLLLDEHTSALDPKSADFLMDLTNMHINKNHLTTIMITHSLEQALYYGNRLIAIKEGKIIADLCSEQKSALSKSELIDLAF